MYVQWLASKVVFRYFLCNDLHQVLSEVMFIVHVICYILFNLHFPL